MDAGELRKGSTVGVGDAPDTPCVESLRGLFKMRPNDGWAYRSDQNSVGVQLRCHAPLYQRSVYISRGQSFIGLANALMQKLAVANDPAFGERLRQLIPLAGYKNARQFAIKGMEWPEAAGPQRLNGYLKGRIPEIETVVAMAEKLRVSVADLLGLHEVNSPDDETLTGILRHMMMLEGIPEDKAGTIASASLAAQRLLRGFPDEEPLPTRTKYAARAAWLQQQSQ